MPSYGSGPPTHRDRFLTLLLRQSTATGGGDYGGQGPQVIEVTNGLSIEDAIAKGAAREGMPMPIPSDSVVGRWAGDRVTLVGDYDDSGLYQAAKAYRNISGPLVDTWNRFIEVDSMKLSYCDDCCASGG